MIWEWIGKTCIFYIAVKTFLLLYRLFRSYFLPKLGLRVNFKSHGEWAVVTGATDGIGKAYAMELARLGLKIVLISRSQDKLDKVASEIKEAYGTETRTVCYDFLNTDGYGIIEKALSGLEIGTLVNNVGATYDYPENFDKVSRQTIEKVVYVNVVSTIMMTHIVIKDMVQRKKGIVIMVCSAASDRPVSLISTYSASKAFGDFLCRALQKEYRSKGIIFQSFCPFFVSTKMSGLEPSFSVPDPTTYVRSALGALGNADRSYGYIAHELQGLAISLLPDVISEAQVSNLLMEWRAAALKGINKND